MRSAAALLTNASSIEGIVDILRTARLASDIATLGADVRTDLGLGEFAGTTLAASTGSIRVLVGELRGDQRIRETMQRTARTLSVRAPNVLWLVAMVQPGVAAAIAGWLRDDAAGSPRIASFSWEPGRVVDSDAETLCALAALPDQEDVLLHARLIEVLGRDALTRRFYRALRAQMDSLTQSVSDRIDPADAHDVALLYISRLLFLCFLEAKGWLNGERAFVATRYDACMRKGGRFHERVLLPLFFGTLNTPASRRSRTARGFGAVPFLNGGLFS